MAVLLTLGTNISVVIEFCAGVLAIYIFGAMLVTAVQAIKEFINQS